MVLMAGMLPGVECARRRRIRQQGVVEGTRRPSLCLYAGGHDHHANLGSSSAHSSKERSSGCSDMARVWTTTLDSNAREAKERLDQRLRSQRESLVKRGESIGGDDGANNRSLSSLGEEARQSSVLQREVLAKNARLRSMWWSRLGRRPPSECAVCLEKLRGGDVLLQLPCAHRFHWACAVPWVKAASRCPVCRAQVHLLASS